LAIESCPGDAIFFLGRILIHNTVDIQGGVRNIVDAFVHQTPLSWKDKMHKELTRYGRKGKSRKKIRNEEGRRKRKREQIEEEEEEERTEEIEKAKEGKELDTEWEIDNMYTGEVEEAGESD